ncbi:immunity 50 family protein [Azospirillum canadense]|uniref:immunity 50 family protein n=1 Tax=Azospirillum canadense TaxID=403962 RepID=UPI002226E6CF|nr:immunity 50 family protein [Azospirillum canadense]MCW2241615.1 hypothetical protein [Azospirillum canadense]
MTSLSWMNWVDVLAHPHAVRSLFTDMTSFETFARVDLHEINIDREGPVLRLRFDIPIVPSSPPKRWQKGVCVTQFVLAAWRVSSIDVQGFGWEVPGELTGAWTSETHQALALCFSGPACQLRATCEVLRVERVSEHSKSIGSAINFP